MEAYRLQRISPLDVIGKRAANVREEPSLILGILRALEARLRGSQVEIRAGELGVLPHRLSRSHRLVPNDLRGRGARFKEALLSQSPSDYETPRRSEIFSVHPLRAPGASR